MFCQSLYMQPLKHDVNKALEELGEDVQSFEKDLVADGRSAMVMLVAEHGAALNGSAMNSTIEMAATTAAWLRSLPSLMRTH